MKKWAQKISRSHMLNVLLLLLLLLLVATSHASQPYSPPAFPQEERLARIQPLLSEIDALYQAHATENHFPGYAYGIVLDGQLVHTGSGGFIDIEKQIPATAHSLFRAASMTKSFTAMAILRLRDEGKLQLDDPIALYIPEMRDPPLSQDAKTITIRDLLTHSAGFSTDDPWADRKLEISDDALLAFLKEGFTLSNPPGTAFEYSNLGYALLGHVVNKITGMSCGEYIRGTIWQPLGMEEAAWEFADVPGSQLAHGYRWMDSGWQEEALLHDGAFGPMGGMIASVDSFSRYLAYHLAAWPPREEEERGPLKRSSCREMHKPSVFVTLNDDFCYSDGSRCAMAIGYGYGLRWMRDSFGRVFVGHNGGLPGFGSNWCILPEYGLGIVLFANITYGPGALPLNLNALNKLIVEAKLQPRQLPPSPILTQRREELLRLLPHLENATTSGIFADNFFCDRSLESLQQESSNLFLKAGPLLTSGELIPENQLRGSFLLQGEEVDLRISFSLTPENPSRIQHYQIQEVGKHGIHP